MRMIRNGRVDLGGTQMEYAAFGCGSRVLTVLPGLSDGLATVRGKALLLASPYRAVLRDYTVYMFSRQNDLPAGFTIPDMAAAQAAALRKLGAAKTSLLGVSQGGMIAQCFAAGFPEMTERLVLAVTAPAVNDTLRDCISRWIAMAERGDHKALMTDTAEHSYSPEKLKSFRKLYPLLGMIGKPRSYDRFLVNARAILQFDMTARLHEITCPTLVLGGETDSTVGTEAAHQLHEMIAGSRLHIYKGLGHALYEEAADDFYRRVFRFLREDIT